jgi:hypothetical protein
MSACSTAKRLPTLRGGVSTTCRCDAVPIDLSYESHDQ